MEKTISKLTVCFEEPFWVGILERKCKCNYEVCKITFGSEPKDYDVYEFILKHYDHLRFSPSFQAQASTDKRINPKRMQRDIHKQMQNTGIGTKAQQALKLQQEQGKLERKARFREQREAEKDQQYQLRLEKRKEKHKGH